METEKTTGQQGSTLLTPTGPAPRLGDYVYVGDRTAWRVVELGGFLGPYPSVRADDGQWYYLGTAYDAGPGERFWMPRGGRHGRERWG